MTIQETLAEGRGFLESPSPSSFVDTPALDAALLLASVLHTNRTHLIARGNEPISAKDSEAFLSLLARRKGGECVAYILGRKEFRGLEFTVNPQVLVPRPDTETLVEAALEYVDSTSQKFFTTNQHEPTRTLLDLCTGSGAVAISLKNERPFLDVSATDISAGALEIARLNSARLLDLNLSDSKAHASAGGSAINFIESDLFKNVSGKFDIIVSNPPYIPSGEIDTLAPELRREPRLALSGGADGLEFIKKIISGAPEHLVPGGVLFLEADYRQMPAIRNLLAANGFCDVTVHRDLAGRDRVIQARKIFTA